MNLSNESAYYRSLSGEGGWDCVAGITAAYDGNHKAAQVGAKVGSESGR